MQQSKTLSWLKGLAHFWKDLILLVLGIYLALWMENKVQSWNDDEKQREYMYRLSLDLASDEKQIENMLPQLESKISRLQQAVGFLQNPDLDISLPEVQRQAVEIAGAVNNYYFFSAQDFTFLSMLESGDFKLLSDDEIKTQLLKLNNRYSFIQLLQDNYMQGLDDEFIPLWVRHADMINNTLVDPGVILKPIFKNMIGFAWNETNQRKALLNTTLWEIKALRIRLENAAQL